MATAAKGAALDRLQSAGGVADAAERGQQAAWEAGNTKAAPAAPAVPSGSPDAAPTWARQLQSQQTARHRRQMAAHTIKEGDRGGAGITPDIDERD